MFIDSVLNIYMYTHISTVIGGEGAVWKLNFEKFYPKIINKNVIIYK